MRDAYDNTVYSKISDLLAANSSSFSMEQRREIASDMGICSSKPKYPIYAVYARRLASFDKEEWKIEESRHELTPQLMAEAGLVYTGHQDAVRCYHCGGGLRNWDPNDDVWAEHAKFYPHCTHIILTKGEKKGKEFLSIE